MSVPTHDAAVLGAGIVGAACVRALARAGLSTIVIDRAPIGSGATAAGMGHIRERWRKVPGKGVRGKGVRTL